ncbi:hypothetical protein [Mesorhizobium sp. WSM4884]|uniref:hypothetical protein n=1 Tax=Mesorhizobium sp. WSM4884 TaxID=3038542 RepID=UPI00241671FA|nr:hypothetical protein [Mesorhizobium sp. WSM4884]MDG4885344.1 hypothetical protein [Mesorhizobium sp. WSM4884]
MSKPIEDLNMDEKRLLAFAKDHYVLFAIIPVAAGACYTSGYLFPIGSSAIEIVNYVDFINFSIIAAMFFSCTFGIVYSSIKIREKYTAMLGNDIIGLVSRITFIAVIASFMSVIFYNWMFPSYMSSFLIGYVLTCFVLPNLYLYIMRKGIVTPYMLAAFFIIGGGFAMGVALGQLKKNFLSISDQVCTDKCYRVGVYAMLSDFVITLDCTGRTLFFPRGEVKKVILAVRSTDFQRERADDGSQCLNDSVVKN